VEEGMGEIGRIGLGDLRGGGGENLIRGTERIDEIEVKVNAQVRAESEATTNQTTTAPNDDRSQPHKDCLFFGSTPPDVPSAACFFV
jgi:hypothetical protein